MINLSKKNLPCAVEVHGRFYPVHTDFQYFVTFARMAKEKHSADDYDFIYDGLIPSDKLEGFHALAKFAFPKKELPKDLGNTADEIVLDYEKDADLIYSAFYHYYNIDLMDSSLHLHWYKFIALLDGIKETRMNDVMGYRMYTPSQNDGKEYKAQMLRLKEMWRIEEPLTEEEQAEVDKFEKLAGGKH